MGKAIAYLRVSTQQQHRSGLGIEAQRTAVGRFAEVEGITIIREFVEAETGKGADALDRRPQLAAALARISHPTKCIGAPNRRKLLCSNDFRAIRGAPRCRQSVAQICSNLHPLRGAK